MTLSTGLWFLTLLILLCSLPRGPPSLSFLVPFPASSHPSASLPLHLCLSPQQASGQTPYSLKGHTNQQSLSIHWIKKGREERSQLQPRPACSAAGIEGFCSEPKRRRPEVECGGSWSILVLSFMRKESESTVRSNSALGCESGLWFKSELWLPQEAVLMMCRTETTFLYFLYLLGTPAFFITLVPGVIFSSTTVYM